MNLGGWPLGVGVKRREKNAVMRAAESGDPDTVALLLDAGADIEAKDDSGQTALMYAASGPRPGFRPAPSRHPDTVALLLDRGADIEAKDGRGRTALMCAVFASQGHRELALLLDRGTNVNAANDDGRTALMFAAEYGYTDTAALLRAAQEARELAAMLPIAHDDPMNRPARRPVGAREPEQASPSRRPRL